MAKYSQGIFEVTNKKKYVGKNPPVYRSSWERRVFTWLDNNPSVISWASEAVRIPYRNPFTDKVTNYIPDLLISYVDKNGKQHTEMVEIKPLKETVLERAKSKKDKMTLALNFAKWEAAKAWCRDKGIFFRVITENEIFFNKK